MKLSRPMKKNYISPTQQVYTTSTDALLAGSVSSNNGIEYGGVDTDGSLDPSVKANPFGDSLFDE